jgi:hypothetical protein
LVRIWLIEAWFQPVLVIRIWPIAKLQFLLLLRVQQQIEAVASLGPHCDADLISWFIIAWMDLIESDLFDITNPSIEMIRMVAHAPHLLSAERMSLGWVSKTGWKDNPRDRQPVGLPKCLKSVD